MKFDHDIEAFIKDFVKDLRENNVAIFAGAGMSKGAGFVDWPGLLADIAEELGLSVNKEYDLISLAQYHVNHRGNRSGIKRKILEEFSEQAEPSKTHTILSQLPIQTYWTTNYDTLIEDTLRKYQKIPDVKFSVKQLANTRPKRDAVVYKMHGDVHSPDDAIITKEQYEAYHRSHALFITALSGDLISKTFLFIGFSFSDPNLDYVLSRLNQESVERQHYCFMKKESRATEDDDETFKYKQRKQNLRVADLKRYKIKALLVEDYPEIFNILEEIERRYKKNTVFISGSAEEYGEWSRIDAQKFIHKLSKEIISSGATIVNGFGWGVGSAVINGALEEIYENYEKSSEDQLIVRPFPQFETGNHKLSDLWEEYRQRMISLAGIAIFIFGNKFDNDKKIVPANGVLREFEISIEHGLIPIPIASTSYAAKDIFNTIEKDPHKFYGDMGWIFNDIKELSNTSLTIDEIAKKTAIIIKKLNK
ncbi:SIR2 family protein [Burkholderia cepacia]|uniref:SIR2 family protein n=1 Tax=Burkholderia cepacia TaxID=292 RepID=UPI002AB2BCEF|nr:SIR2 family protein [Burkholderia cepacia]